MVISAAVIGRQLRQQTRTSGPLNPPQQPKPRPRTPSHASGRPYSPALTTSTLGTYGTGGTTGTTGDLQQLPPPTASSTTTQPLVGHYTYHDLQQQQQQQPHLQPKINYNSINYQPHHPSSQKRNKEDEPQLKCTWHCFCIALKALSGGLFLLVIGTAMSIIGFFAEHNLMSEVHWSESSLSESQKANLTTYRNLTYAGPVIMGLGGIMVVAALVLTFEVRDTLGVKVVPSSKSSDAGNLSLTKSANSLASPLPIVASQANTRKSTVASISSTIGSTKGPLLSSTRKLGTEMSLPLTQLNVPCELTTMTSTTTTTFDRSRLHETIHETSMSESLGDGQEESMASKVSLRRNDDDVINEEAFDEVIVGTNDDGGTSGGAKPRSVMLSSSIVRSPSPTMTSTTTTTTADRPPQVSIASNSRSCVTIFTTSSSSMRSYNDSRSLLPDHAHQYLLDAIDGGHGLFELQSPPDPELSDPEGCSVMSGLGGGTFGGGTIDRWRTARCSCSVSPASSAFDLYYPSLNSTSSTTRDHNRDIFVLIDSDRDDDPFDDDPSLKDQLFEQQRLQQKLLQQQKLLLQQQQQQLALQQRLLLEQKARQVHPTRQRAKTIASIESDGLSSTSGSVMADDAARVTYIVPTSSSTSQQPQSSSSSRKNQYPHHSSSLSNNKSTTTTRSHRSATTKQKSTMINPQQPQNTRVGSISSTSSKNNNGNNNSSQYRNLNYNNKRNKSNHNNNGRTHVASVKVHRELRDDDDDHSDEPLIHTSPHNTTTTISTTGQLSQQQPKMNHNRSKHNNNNNQVVCNNNS